MKLKIRKKVSHIILFIITLTFLFINTDNIKAEQSNTAESSITYHCSFNNLKSDEEYVFAVVKNINESDVLNEDNVYFIDQKTCNSDGSVDFICVVDTVPSDENIVLLGNGNDNYLLTVWYLDDATLYVMGNVADYSSAEEVPWCSEISSISYIVLSNKTETIGNYAFANAENLTSIKLPEGLKSIGENAFSNCSNLKDVYLFKNSYGDTYFDNNLYNKIYMNGEDITGRLEGYSLSLSGEIGVNYYMSLEQSVKKDSKAYMEFTLPNGKTKQVKISDATTSEVNGNLYYVFPCYVSAKDMTSSIKAQLHLSDGSVGIEYDYTVNDYVNYLISNASSMGYTSDQISIAKTLLTYGKYTQEYFEYNTSNIPKKVNELTSCNLSQEAYVLTDNNDSINFVGARLVLTSKPGLKLYFNSNAEIICTDGTISTEGKYKVVTITDINNIYTKYNVTGTNFSLEYSIASYGNLALKGSDDSLKNLINSMVAYYNLFNE